VDRLLSILLGKPYLSDYFSSTTVDGISYDYLSQKNNLVNHLDNKVIEGDFLGHSQLYFENWFAKQEKLELFIKNFFSVYGQRGVLVENRFVSYVSAIENYYKNNIDPNAYLKPAIEDLLIKSSISYHIKDISELSKIYKFTRVYHVHLEKDKKDKSFTNDELIDANLILEFLIREIILHEMGVGYVPPISSYLTQSINKLNKRC
jgi:hypothetical protein